jgi:hypothetical protein
MSPSLLLKHHRRQRRDGSVGVWEADTGLLRVALQCPQAAAIARITLSPDARLPGRCCRRPRVMRVRVQPAVVVAAGVAWR